MKRISLFLFLLFTAWIVHAQLKGKPMQQQHAEGTFTVDVKPLSPTPADGINRYSINKHLQGDLEGNTQGEMFSAGDPQHGHAGYVAIERVTGTLAGKHGSFVLQHLATIDANGPQMTVQVVPGSGTEGFVGLTGTFQITVVDGQHRYTFNYTLAE